MASHSSPVPVQCKTSFLGSFVSYEENEVLVIIGNKKIFFFPSNLKFECEFKYTEYLRRTKYLFMIYQTSQIQILIN